MVPSFSPIKVGHIEESLTEGPRNEGERAKKLSFARAIGMRPFGLTAEHFIWSDRFRDDGWHEVEGAFCG